MIYCKELNKEFESKAEMFKALRNSHKDIIADKTAKIYNSDCNNEKNTIKAFPLNASKIDSETIKELDLDSDYYYIAVNTTGILDNHGDLHLAGIWNKTKKEQQGKVYLVWDHELKGGSTIVRKEHIEMLIKEMPFSVLGMPYEGNCEALIYKFHKDKVIDEKAEEWLESGDEIQASVRMQYIKMLFALNSEAKEDVEYKKNYDKYYPQISNKDDFENDIDYFWPVLEAKNKLESSLVLFGSNHVTGMIEEEKINQPSNDTDKNIEPSNDTQKENIFEYLIKNLKQ